MNQNTYEILEFNRIKEKVSEFALTDLGKEQIKDIIPSTNMKQIRAWLDEVTESVEIIKKSSSIPISGLNGIEQILQQLNKGLTLRPDQFMKLIDFLTCCKKLKKFMKDKEFLAPRVTAYVYSIEELPHLLEEIEKSIRNSQVDDYASKELLKLRKQITILDERLKEKVNQIVRSNKYKTYIQEAIVSERNGRYVIPVKKEHKGKIPGTVLDTSASGATLYIEPTVISSFHDEINSLKAYEEMEVERILTYLTGLVEENQLQIRLAVETMVHYDVLFAKAKYSREINGRSVEMNDSHHIYLKEARHPLLGKQAVPLTVELGRDYQALVITGPNTGGKTVTLKTVGLLTLMIQSGFHIPVAEGSHVSIFQKVLLDIGDGQSIEQNLSTFSSHIKNIIDILKEANDHSLILLDELGSGTDPGEGMGLATALLKQFSQKGTSMLATTHYSEIKDFADQQDGFINGSMEFDIESLKPTYRLIIGKGGDSQAFGIALKLGMHPKIIEDAHRITYKEEKEYVLDETDLYIKKELEKQISINRFARNKTQEKRLDKEKVENFFQGDNVRILATGEFGIIYKGPDSMGNYIVQVQNEKRTYNHKRLKLYISAKELYPDDYDFNIIFETKENRKVERQMEKRHVDGLVINHKGEK
ncbi:endonuclease MutS2 [Lederbergia citrea]|uniref:Endonuclease MutS2 n=1 Tax=Lederbergia citrea TaxID=2833581 RepID=A0A942UN76_9BACI|nr:endonuclease MutS2 [Lederbergia citrea]MBS4176771.1 endonuclease MutS2 [Lederbergia citrea]MBS4221996.1 endonuclease MutS2 [Lederbergia citrea]